MTVEERLKRIEEIKQIERELYERRSELASAEAMADNVGDASNLNPKDWKQAFARCIEEIGRTSTGGNSVEDVRKERREFLP